MQMKKFENPCSIPNHFAAPNNLRSFSHQQGNQKAV